MYQSTPFAPNTCPPKKLLSCWTSHFGRKRRLAPEVEPRNDRVGRMFGQWTTNPLPSLRGRVRTKARVGSGNRGVQAMTAATHPPMDSKPKAKAIGGNRGIMRVTHVVGCRNRTITRIGNVRCGRPRAAIVPKRVDRIEVSGQGHPPRKSSVPICGNRGGGGAGGRGRYPLNTHSRFAN